MIKWLIIYWIIGWAANNIILLVGLLIDVKNAKKLYLERNNDDPEWGKNCWKLSMREAVIRKHLDELEIELESHLLFSNKELQAIETLIESRLLWPINIVYAAICLRRVQKKIERMIEEQTLQTENDTEIKVEVG